MSGSCKFVCPAALALDDAYRPERTLGFWRLLGILYMVSCCGAYATEAMVEAGGGPLLCIIGLLVLPCLWRIPIATFGKGFAMQFMNGHHLGQLCRRTAP